MNFSQKKQGKVYHLDLGKNVVNKKDGPFKESIRSFGITEQQQSILSSKDDPLNIINIQIQSNCDSIKSNLESVDSIQRAAERIKVRLNRLYTKNQKII